MHQSAAANNLPRQPQDSFVVRHVPVWRVRPDASHSAAVHCNLQEFVLQPNKDCTKPGPPVDLDLSDFIGLSDLTFFMCGVMPWEPHFFDKSREKSTCKAGMSVVNTCSFALQEPIPLLRLNCQHHCIDNLKAGMLHRVVVFSHKNHLCRARCDVWQACRTSSESNK